MTVDRESFYEAKYAAGEEIQRTSKLYTLASVPAGKALKILDVGCGTGVNSAWLVAQGHQVTGIDISSEAIAKYGERGFAGRVMNVEAGIDFDDRSFDCVFCSEVIEHVIDPHAFAKDLFRVLRPGGTLVLSTPNSAFWVYRVLSVLGRTLSEVQHTKHIHFFSKRSLVRLIRETGFGDPEILGRNMYALIPDPGISMLVGILSALGFRRETRFRTGKDFWHLSNKSQFWNTLFADTLIVRAHRPNG